MKILVPETSQPTLWSRAIQRLVDHVCNEDHAPSTEVRAYDKRTKNANREGAEASNPINMGVSEAAIYLRVSPNTIYKWTSQGRIPYRKVGTKKLSFCKEELDRFIASRRVADDTELQERAAKTAGKLQMKRSHAHT